MTLGPQFADIHEARKFVEGSKDDVISGPTARAVFRAANIRSWPMNEMPTQMREGWSREYKDTVYPHETLHTAQGHLHIPTLKKYLAGDVPENDPEYDYDDNSEPVPYLPETVVSNDNRATRWIDEGHHRLVASRLRGDYSTRVWGGPLFSRR